jgi:hypothetical protein
MFKFQSFLALAVTCVACGASFSATEGSGGAGGVGQAGAASAGETSAAGSSSAGDAGEPNVGGTGSAGEGSLAGAGGSAAGRAGSGSGGAAAGAGGSAGVDCVKLRQQYQAAVESARICDKGSTDQCSTSSVAEPINCGCPVLVNAQSDAAATAKKLYRAYQDGKCDGGGIICDIYCAPAMSASCAQQSSGSGSRYVCTAGIAVQN